MKIVYTFKPFYSAQRVTVQKLKSSGLWQQRINGWAEILPRRVTFWTRRYKIIRHRRLYGKQQVNSNGKATSQKEHALASRRLELPYHHVPGYG